MRTRTSSSSRPRLAITRLEDRVTPAVAVTFVNGVLNAIGDGAADTIAVNQVNGQITVSGTTQTFAASQVRAIAIDGGDGDDTITLSSAVTPPALLFGGNGNDRLTGGGANDQIYGGLGNDTLDGNSGNDALYGGYGTDSFADTQGTNTTNQGSPNVTASNSALEQQIVTLVNQQRAAAGLPALTVNVKLNAAAFQHSTDMAGMSYVVGTSAAMQHTLSGSTLPTLVSRADYAGYDYMALGENIAYGYSDANSVMNAWMNSAGHRANILNTAYTEIGVSVQAGVNGTLYFTQEFGKQMPTSSGSYVTASGQVVSGSTTTTATSTSAVTVPTTLTALSTVTQRLYAVGAGNGGGPQVVVYNAATGAQIYNFFAYDPAFRGGVRVATGDVTGDGYEDIITSPGQGGGPHVKVYDGRTGQLVRQWMAYETTFTGGVYMSVGDINGDGKADVVTGTGVGGGPLVKVFDGATGNMTGTIIAYDSMFRGGVTAAAGDVNGDGRADIVTGTGPGGGPHIKVFDGRTLAESRSFMAYDPAFRGGVTVSAGDVNGDGKADIITGEGPGATPTVKVFDGNSLAVLGSFDAFATNYAGGVRVGTADLNSDGKADVLVAGGQGTADARGFTATGGTLRDVTAFDPSFQGGAYVG
ncbi:MAG: FG-GAP-like repeat-containing protein [Gemmataceae bacterium]